MRPKKAVRVFHKRDGLHGTGVKTSPASRALLVRSQLSCVFRILAHGDFSYRTTLNTSSHIADVRAVTDATCAVSAA